MSLAAQTAVLARRSIVGTARQPGVWLPPVLFPLIIAAVNTAAFNRATALPGFPEVDSFLDFVLPATIVQGALIGAIDGGAALALDIEGGFFDRLLASPVSRPAILVGRLASAATLGAVQAVLFTSLFVVFGARIAGGVAGVLVLVLVGVLVALFVGGWAAALAMRTASQEAVQNAFPIVFILLFVSSAFFPTELMKGWYQTVAELNPISWIINGARHLVIEGWSWTAAASAVGTAAVLASLTVALAALALRRRLAALT